MPAEAPPSLLDQLARGWRGYVLVALIALASSLFGASSLPVMDRDEARFAQATRQMVESGDYVRIRVQETDRNKKPIGIHWLQAAAVNALSPLTHSDNAIWTYRLPSALGAMLAALATLWAGTALFGARIGLVGGVLFSAGVLLGFEGMTAKTDAALVGFTTLSMAALAQLYAGTTRPKLINLVFWFALGWGVLIKGPITPMVATLTLIALGLWSRRWAWMRPLAWWPGPLMAVLIVAPWMIAIGLATHGQFFVEAVTGDLAPKLAGGDEGHFVLPGFHLALLTALIFPAAYALPAAARLGWRTLRTRRDDDAFAPHRFLLAWIIPSFLVFEAAPTKLAHYTMPTYPAIALLCAAAVFIAAQERWRITQAIGLVLFALAGAALTALLAAGATFMPGDGDAQTRRAIVYVVIGALLVLGALIGLIATRSVALRALIAAACALLFSFAIRQHLLPETRTLLVSSEITATLARNNLLPTDARRLWVTGYAETSLVFMTRTDIRIVPPDHDLPAQAGDAIVIEQRAFDVTMATLAARGLAFEPIDEGPVLGLNVGNGDDVQLHIGRIVAAPTPQAAPPS